MVNQLLPWIVFNLFVLAMLALDLGVFHRKAHTVGIRESLAWSAVWIFLALLFNVGIYFVGGSEAALNFLTGYVLEKSLSIDNIFVFLLIFSYFKVERAHQHSVLFWGILGALIMRAIFILAGVTLMQRFHWIIYFFGPLLIITGIRMAFKKEREIHPERNPVLRLVRRFFRVSNDYVGGKFFFKHAGSYFITPLLIVLLIVETTDIIFAVDSIPAVLAITTDAFIVYSSNVFAILGLRALYFALSGLMQLFHYLHYGLSAVLVFVGMKMLCSGIIEIPVILALCVIACILAISVAASILFPRQVVADETGSVPVEPV
jgi:tellurite resistance protein TerC